MANGNGNGKFLGLSTGALKAVGWIGTVVAVLALFGSDRLLESRANARLTETFSREIARIDNLGVRMNLVESSQPARLTNIENRLTNIERRLTTIESDANDLEDDVEDLEDAVYGR